VRSFQHSHLKRFKRFLLESHAEEPSLVQLQIAFDFPYPDPLDAIMIALDKANWMISSLGLEDGAILLSPTGDEYGINAWDFLVVSPDAKVAFLLNSSLLNGYLGESITVHQQTISNRLLGASGWRGTNSPTPTASQRWCTPTEVQRGLRAGIDGFEAYENL
jgi:hypothetical protein